MASSSKTPVVSQKKHTPVSTLGPDQGSSTIVVRVLRKWYLYTARSGDIPVAVELVLVDKEVPFLRFILTVYLIYAL